MKKHLAADVLAARLSAAANQPPAVTDAPAPPPTVEQAPTETMRKQPKLKAVLTAKDADENTVPISLRPGRSLLDRYVNAAAERTRKAGRVISAQQIMLEVLERGI
jgi:hypothetical protein